MNATVCLAQDPKTFCECGKASEFENVLKDVGEDLIDSIQTGMVGLVVYWERRQKSNFEYLQSTRLAIRFSRRACIS